MKKNIIISAMVLALTGATTSCSDFLDKEVDLTQQADNIFSDYDNTRYFLANIYTYLPDAFHGYTDGQYLNASKDAMTDNAVSYWDVHYYHQVHNDAFDATNHQFANYYYGLDTRGIRACNQFIKNARTDVIGNAEKSGDDNRLGDRWLAEARAIRAILTFDMACWFGPTPIFVTEEGEPYIMNTSDPMPDRRSFAEVVDWIVSECDAIKDKLPFRYQNEDENWGRINGASVYALKSRALLYKASPLNNPNNDQSWWQAAAQAADDFIAANSRLGSRAYRLYSNGDPQNDYYNCFVSNPVLNPEYILSQVATRPTDVPIPRRTSWTPTKLSTACPSIRILPTTSRIPTSTVTRVSNRPSFTTVLSGATPPMAKSAPSTSARLVSTMPSFTEEPSRATIPRSSSTRCRSRTPPPIVTPAPSSVLARYCSTQQRHGTKLATPRRPWTT